MSTEAFKGTTAECSADFFQRYQWETVQPVLANITGVEKPTVRRWYRGALPRGSELLALRVTLDAVGYQVDEFATLIEPMQKFTQALVLGLISIDDATEMLNYSTPSGVYSLLVGGTMPKREKGFRLERFVENSQEELAKKLAEFRQQLSQLPLEKGYQSPGAVASPPVVDPVPTPLANLDPALPVMGLGLTAGAVEQAAAIDNSAADLRVVALGHSLMAAATLSRAVFESNQSVRLVQMLYGIIDKQDLRMLIEEIELVFAVRSTD